MAFGELHIRSDVCGIDYGTDSDIDGTPAGFTEVYAGDIEEEIGIEHAEVDVQKTSGALGPEPLLVGPKTAALKFKVPWRGGEQSDGSPGASLITTLGQHMGLELRNRAGGVGKITGGTTSTMTCLDADNPGWEVGDFIILEVNGTVMMRQIIRLQGAGGTTEITVTPDMGDSPVNGEDFFPTDTLVPAPAKVSTYTAFDVYRGEGAAADRIKYRLLGGAGTFRLEDVAAGGLPWAVFEFAFGGGWTDSVASRVHVADTYADPLLFLSDQFYLDDDAVHLSSLAFNPGLQRQALPGQTATGIQGFVYLRPKPELSIKPLFDEQFIADYEGGTSRKAFYARVGASSNAWAIGLLDVQFQKAGGREDYVDGVAGAGIECRINDPGLNDDDEQLPLFALGFSGV
jgi:hypothetical protein